MSGPVAIEGVTLDAQQAYARWASSYDETPNPLLMLENRCLLPEMRKLAGRDFLDLGCGTGRWLRHLEAWSLRSITGVDASEAMLAEAAKNCRPSTRLIHSGCTEIPLADGSADTVLASFLLSYVEDLAEFSREAARVLRPGGMIILSDLHPATRSYGWRRTFKSADKLFEITTFEYDLPGLVDAMNTAGFKLEILEECCFDREDEAVFRQAGKIESFNQVEFLPVIYWARFSLQEH
jgi:ubiquinone/menaquinone biosynthesis C-methylase UbiE